MSHFWVNNKEYNIDENKSLLRFLRDDLRLTSVKDGCAEGACGTCHVIVEGRAVKACGLKLSSIEDRHVIKPPNGL